MDGGSFDAIALDQRLASHLSRCGLGSHELFPPRCIARSGNARNGSSDRTSAIFVARLTFGNVVGATSAVTRNPWRSGRNEPSSGRLNQLAPG
jgi:hypothetical protein